MNKELISFEDMVNIDNQILDNLMLGNGFSIYFGSRFRYNNLYEEARQQFDTNDEKLFEQFGTRNFETALRALGTAIETNAIFNIDVSQIEESYERIKSALIETVKKVHPEPQEIPISQINELEVTLNTFKRKVFTTNYDLLGYWALNRINGRRKVSDGFGWDRDSNTIMFDAGPGVSESENPLRLYYLHGSLHLYMQEGEIIKITKKMNPVGTTDNPLLITITDTYDAGYFPLYVSEGTWKQKLSKIRNNKYLNYCYSALQNISGGMTIFGLSLDIESDKHLIEAVKKSKISKLAYGIFDVDNFDLIKHEIRKSFYESSIQIEFFDSRNFFQSLSNLQWES